MAGIDVPDSSRRNFEAGFMSSTRRQSSLLGRVGQQVAQGADYECCRLRENAGQKEAVFRLVTPDDGFNYQVMTLARSPDGKVRAIDIFTATKGEQFSKTIRRMLIPLVASENRSLLSKLAGEDHALITHINGFSAITKATQAGQHVEVLRIYRQLPLELQKEKSVLLLGLSAASMLQDTDEYVRIYNLFESTYPKDPAMAIMSINYHRLRNEHDEALAAVNTLDAFVRGDPWLGTIRANIYLDKKDFNAARREAQKVLDWDSRFLEPYWTILIASAEEKAFDQTLACLKRIDANFDISWENVLQQADYVDFVKSPQYQQWLDYLESKK